MILFHLDFDKERNVWFTCTKDGSESRTHCDVVLGKYNHIVCCLNKEYAAKHPWVCLVLPGETIVGCGYTTQDEARQQLMMLLMQHRDMSASAAFAAVEAFPWRGIARDMAMEGCMSWLHVHDIGQYPPPHSLRYIALGGPPRSPEHKARLAARKKNDLVNVCMGVADAHRILYRGAGRLEIVSLGQRFKVQIWLSPKPPKWGRWYMDTDMLYYTVKIRVHPNATHTFVAKTTNEAIDQIRTYIQENVV